jgi:hypothetical protein
VPRNVSAAARKNLKKECKLLKENSKSRRRTLSRRRSRKDPG